MSALLLLLVTTILGIAMFRSFGLLERIAGNTREKQRAVNAAESAQTYAEWWLTSNSGINATTGAACANPVTATATVCSNVLASPATLPWGTGGVSYNPGNTMLVGAGGNYYSAPVFYISFLSTSYNPSTGTTTNSYQIDAAGYAGTSNSTAVVEDTYNVSVTYTSQDSLTKFQNLGGP